MACGKKHYLKLKERKKYKDIILLLQADNGSYWTYNDDAVSLASALHMECHTNQFGEFSFNPKEEDISTCFDLRHLGGNAYQAIKHNSTENKPKTYRSISKLLELLAHKPPKEVLKESEQPDEHENKCASSIKAEEKLSGREHTRTKTQEDEHPQKSCDNCQLRKSGKCPNLRNQLCSDYLAIPYIPPEEKSWWPDKGDASAAMNGEKRYYD